jgi:hypothetical protein
MAALASGDEPRRGDLDGRGALSDAGLRHFCEFFLGTAIDQIDFMSELLDIDGLEQRIAGFVERQVAARRTRPEAAYLLREALLPGEFPRGEAPRVTGLAERTARTLVSELVRAELLTSDSPKGNLRLGFPARAVGYYFPRLYPESVEATLDGEHMTTAVRRAPVKPN